MLQFYSLREHIGHLGTTPRVPFVPALSHFYQQTALPPCCVFYSSAVTLCISEYVTNSDVETKGQFPTGLPQPPGFLGAEKQTDSAGTPPELCCCLQTQTSSLVVFP